MTAVYVVQYRGREKYVFTMDYYFIARVTGRTQRFVYEMKK